MTKDSYSSSEPNNAGNVHEPATGSTRLQPVRHLKGGKTATLTRNQTSLSRNTGEYQRQGRVCGDREPIYFDFGDQNGTMTLCAVEFRIVPAIALPTYGLWSQKGIHTCFMHEDEDTFCSTKFIDIFPTCVFPLRNVQRNIVRQTNLSIWDHGPRTNDQCPGRQTCDVRLTDPCGSQYDLSARVR